MAENQYGFPTEVLSLPSQGLLYPEDSPLRSGTIDVKYMTAKEEDILTSTNLIEKGVVITKLLESIIADPKVKLNDILIGDKNSIMVGTRILGYGKDYGITLIDPDTNERVEHVVDLTKLENKPIDKSLYENGNSFILELPNSKRVIGFKLLTQSDEAEIEETLKDYEKVEKLTGVSYAGTTRLKHQIVSIDDNTDQKEIDNFVDNEFLALDTRAFRKHLDEITPDIELKFDYTSQTGNLHRLDVPLGIDFFGQPPSNRAAIHEELFNIAYYGNGFIHNDLYNMPVPLRRFYAQKLVEAKQKEAESIKKASQTDSNQIQRPNIQKS